MGFYLRKSIRVGPLRFNLSKSGVGVSAGVTGLRVGTGPRGNYVHVGRGGIYFRKSIPSANTNGSSSPQPAAHHGGIDFEKIESGAASRMVDSSSAEFLAEVNVKLKRWRIWPWVGGAGLMALAVVPLAELPLWTAYVMGVTFFCGWLVALYCDALRKTVVLFYDLDSHVEQAYAALHTTFEELRGCSHMWHVESKGNVTSTHDSKVNAGAGHLVKRNQERVAYELPPYFKTNISVPMVPCGRQRLYFFPDRILFWDSSGVGTVSFDRLEVAHGERQFIEDGSVPRDSVVVGSTWQYVNKEGGPDKRFSNNRQIPIVLYEEILLQSGSGLRELFQVSRRGPGANLAASVKRMAEALTVEPPPLPAKGHLRCLCNTCSGSIEFPAEGVGAVVACPHCSLETMLFNGA